MQASFNSAEGLNLLRWCAFILDFKRRTGMRASGMEMPAWFCVLKLAKLDHG